MAITTLIIIKNWFKAGLKPTQQQFWDTWDSFWHKETPIPQNAVQNLENTLINKADAALLEEHINDANAHNSSWGNITGTVSNQEDLVEYINGQIATSGGSGGGGTPDLQKVLDKGSNAVVNTDFEEYKTASIRVQGPGSYTEMRQDMSTLDLVRASGDEEYGYSRKEIYLNDENLTLSSLDPLSNGSLISIDNSGFYLVYRDADYGGNFILKNQQILNSNTTILTLPVPEGGGEYFLPLTINGRAADNKGNIDISAGETHPVSMLDVVNASSVGYNIATGNGFKVYMNGLNNQFSWYKGVTESILEIAAREGIFLDGGTAAIEFGQGRSRLSVRNDSQNPTKQFYLNMPYLGFFPADVTDAMFNIPIPSRNDNNRYLVASVNGQEPDIYGNVNVSGPSNLQTILETGSDANLATTTSEDKIIGLGMYNSDTGIQQFMRVSRDQVGLYNSEGSTIAASTNVVMNAVKGGAYIYGATGIDLSANHGNIRLSASGNISIDSPNVPIINSYSAVTKITNGKDTLSADTSGTVDISSLLSKEVNVYIPTLQEVVEAGAVGVAPYKDGEIGLRLGQSSFDGEFQGMVCYPSNVNLSSTSVNFYAADIYAEAKEQYVVTSFGDVAFNMPNGKFTIQGQKAVTGNYGKARIIPNSRTTFSIPHGMVDQNGYALEPSYFNLQFSQYTPDLMYYTTTIDDANITITFPKASTETSLEIYWETRP